MPADVKPLFRPDALRPKLAGFIVPPAALAARPKLAEWVKLLASDAGRRENEIRLLPNFISDVFENLLGYVPVPHTPYTIRRESLIEVDGKRADAGFGRFGGGKDEFVAVLEGKGPKDPLDIPFAGRKRSAVDQALQYAVNLRIDWYLVTNLNVIRLYSKQENQRTYETFTLNGLAENDAEFARFVFLLGAERLLAPTGTHLNAVLAESAKIGRELTNQFYAEYRTLREHTFDALKKMNHDRPPAALLTATQKILDRVLFVAFAQKRGLLPPNIIASAYDQPQNPFARRLVWENFKGLFQAVNGGDDGLKIWKYNGGLFAADEFVDALTVPDSVCEGFKKLAEYEYGKTSAADAKLIDVDILGHVFEQSISDLEEMQNAVNKSVAVKKSKKKQRDSRRETGAFYTPAFVTRYIVQETLGPVLRERFEAYRQRIAAEPSKVRGLPKLLATPVQFVVDKLTDPQKTALVAFWEGWIADLETVRVVDPACGSGAFLIEAFDQLFAEYEQAQGFLTQLRGPTLFDIRKAILEHNLYGVDLNGAAVEIARLSCWIKTAEEGKTLTSLDRNIVQGNSVAEPPSPREAWAKRFPEAFAADGFDVVVGNPPYVRQGWIKDIKPYLEQHYKAYDGAADLYVYFYELGLTILKPGGRLGYIVTNKWLKAGYGEPLRKLYGEAAWVEQVTDFGHAKQIFPDADVFPCILVARKPTADPPPAEARVCMIPREQLRIDDLSRQIQEEGYSLPRERFGAEAWSLEPPAVAALVDKLRANGVPLKEFAGGVELLSGIKTGFNDAFLIDTATKNKLVTADPKSEPLFKPYLRGQDIDRWRAEWAGLWMVAMKSSGNHPWPWAGKADAEAEAVFKQTYPALFAHFDQFRPQLVKRQDQGEHWWELRACAYWDAFDRPKVMYQEIQFHPSYLFDTAGKLANNKVFFLPTGDLFLLGVLNSPVVWWHNWRYLPHMKDEALSPVGFLMENLPIPRPTDEARARTEALVKRLIDLKGGRTDGLRALLDWLQTQMEVDSTNKKLEGLIGMTADELVAAVKKARKRRMLTPDELRQLRQAHATNVIPLQALDREAMAKERELSGLVNAAFDLTPAEVQLMWDTAPPRMPFQP